MCKNEKEKVAYDRNFKTLKLHLHGYFYSSFKHVQRICKNDVPIIQTVGGFYKYMYQYNVYYKLGFLRGL